MNHSPSQDLARAIAYHNKQAEVAHRRAFVALEAYGAAMARLQASLTALDVAGATRAEAEADAAWAEMLSLLELGYQHRNSAAIAAGSAVADQLFSRG